MFWLCLSLFPKHFLPEILGLNLAVELCGIGNTYREAADILRFYGFNPWFVELHNTVDNASTGHTAWAKEAIINYMGELLAFGGESQVQKQWERIWTGYRAYARPTGIVSSLANLRLADMFYCWKLRWSNDRRATYPS